MDSIVPHYLDNSLFFKFIKCSELVIFLVRLFMTLASSSVIISNESFFILLMIILNCNVNFLLKNFVARPLFGFFGDYIILLGQGTRPEGAINCGYFDTCPDKIPSSFGFPSGHSQFAGAYSGFMISQILFGQDTNHRLNEVESFQINDFIKKFYNASLHSKFSVLIHFSYILIMMYSRVYIAGCHTIMQTIFGALIGIFIGISSNTFYRRYKSRIQRWIAAESIIFKLFLLLISCSALYSTQ